MTDPQLDVPDPAALRRRVLLTGLLTLAGYLALAWLVVASGSPDWFLLPGLVLLVVLVVRPLMRPVLAAHRLRRRLAYQAFLDDRGQHGDRDSRRG